MVVPDIHHPNSPHEPRLSLSCIQCRSRKVKCDRSDPCSNCKERNLECKKEVLRKPNRKKRPSSGSPLRNSNAARSFVDLDDGADHPMEVISAPLGDQHEYNLPQSFTSSAPPSYTTPPTNLQDLYDNALGDMIFSDSFIDSLLSGDEARSNADLTISSATAALFPNATIPLRNTLCVHRFRIEADQLDQSVLEEYHSSLPAISDIANVIDTLTNRTACLSSRSDINTFLDCIQYEQVLRQHIATFAMGMASSSNQSKTLAKDAFYIVCGLYFACNSDSMHQESNRERLLYRVAKRLERQLSGIDPSLQLLQSYRMLSLALLWRNKTEEAHRAIIHGSRAAISMGIHQVSTMSTYPKDQRPYLTDALLNLTCDSCMMQAVFGTRTSVDPGSIEASLFDLGESILDTADTGCTKGGVTDSNSSRNLPIRLRMHASLWIFLERHYGSGCDLQVPTEERLFPNRPLTYADPYEIGQSLSLNHILTRSSQELERPLLPWLSIPSNTAEKKTNFSEADEIGLYRAIQMLFLVRYYRCLVVYPFITINPEARFSLEETVRSIINSTWRMAKRNRDNHQQSNLDFCRRICLRALALLSASRCDRDAARTQGAISHAEQREQIVAEFELGMDAIEKIDALLIDTKPLAGLVANLQSRNG